MSKDAEDDSFGSGIVVTEDLTLVVDVDVSNTSEVVVDVDADTDTDELEVFPSKVTSGDDAVDDKDVVSEDEGDDPSGSKDIEDEVVTYVVVFDASVEDGDQEDSVGSVVIYKEVEARVGANENVEDSVDSFVVDEEVTTETEGVEVMVIVDDTGAIDNVDASEDAVRVVTSEDDIRDTMVDVCDVTKDSLSDDLKDNKEVGLAVVDSRSSLR